MSQKTPENQASTNINSNNSSLDIHDTSKTLLNLRAGVDAWCINLQILKAASIWIGVQAVAISESQARYQWRWQN
jgi:hypothetical protein